MAAPYHLSPGANRDGTYLVGSVVLVPARLMRRFGKPSPADEHKVSGIFTFADDLGTVFTVYDWKATSLYHEDDNDGQASHWPISDEFWQSIEPCTVSIGGHDTGGTDDFRKWLVSEIG